MIRTLSFTETASGVTYTARTSVPPGGRVLDVLVETTAAWTAATADLDVGDNDAADALAGSVDLTSVAFVNGSSTSGTAWGNAGGDGKAYGDGGTGKLYPSGDTITAVVTAGTPGGPTGVSSVALVIELPSTSRRAVVT